MLDGSSRETIHVVVEEAMQQKLLFIQLRRYVYGWIKTQGGRCVSVDRQDGVIIIDLYSENGERIKVEISESKVYQDSVPLSTW